MVRLQDEGFSHQVQTELSYPPYNRQTLFLQGGVLLLAKFNFLLSYATEWYLPCAVA